MKKTKLYAVAILALLAGVFSACKEEPKPEPELPQPEPEKVEMKLAEAYVFVVKNESAYGTADKYQYSFLDKTENVGYAVIFYSLGNDLKGATNGTYTLIKEETTTTTTEQAIFAKMLPDENSATGVKEVIAETGNVVMKEVAEGIEITATATWADGEEVIYHYKGAAPKLIHIDVFGDGEPNTVSTIEFDNNNIDTLVSELVSLGEGVNNQLGYLGGASLKKPEDLKDVRMFDMYFMLAGTNYKELPDGEYDFKFMENDPMILETSFVFAGDANTSKTFYATQFIAGVNEAGTKYNTYWPQKGKVTVKKQDDGKHNIKFEATTYYGSTIKGDITKKIDFVITNPEEEKVPARLAPRAVKEYGKLFLPQSQARMILR